jgi:hypothetical protein
MYFNVNDSSAQCSKSLNGVICGELHQRGVKDKFSFLLYIFSDGFFLYLTFVLQTRRPKARGLAQHGDPPGWLEKSDPAGGIFNVWGQHATLFDFLFFFCFFVVVQNT